MVDLKSQPPRSFAGGTTAFNEDPEASLTGSPFNVVPHNLLPDFAFNEDEDALVESRVVEDPEPISTEFPVEGLQSKNENVDDFGESRCIRAHEHITFLMFRFLLDSFFLFLVFCFFFYGDSDLYPNGTNDDEDGVQNCTFTELLSTGQFLSESMYFF
ncbi:hypothetical protein HanRHA438_Chr02g0067611 [Helianthus annuus]|nr:hypothetical protein HanLR1_Chr02g0055481 [Helianthus annuus]KAJ0939993.1 hypothetical protein HanRHA438_Chr02g0067611 [Helianthus annuus]